MVRSLQGFRFYIDVGYQSETACLISWPIEYMEIYVVGFLMPHTGMF